MTDADLIRSLYVDCLAGQLYEEWRSRAAGIYPPWDYDTEKDGPYSEDGIVAVNPGGQPRRERWRAQARRLIDALAAAGLLPISIEEQLAGGFRPGIHTFADIVNQTYPPTRTLRRYVTDWRPTPTTEGDQP